MQDWDGYIVDLYAMNNVPTTAEYIYYKEWNCRKIYLIILSPAIFIPQHRNPEHRLYRCQHRENG
jgi:hypothetical protein